MFNIDIIHYVLIALVVVAAVVAFIAGVAYRKNVAEKQIGSAETQATTIVNDAIKSAENKKREMPWNTFLAFNYSVVGWVRYYVVFYCIASFI